MGLAEQLEAGGFLQRTVKSFTTDVSGTGIVDLGLTYVILSIESSDKCRLRLYSDSKSLLDLGEANRTINNTYISESIALIGDFDIPTPGKYYTRPLFGFTTASSHPYTAYRVDSVAPVKLNIRTYQLDSGITPKLGSKYTTSNRRTLTITENLLANSQNVGLKINDPTIPQTYLLISASVDNSNSVRFRLYSTSASLSDSVELSRLFSIEPKEGTKLIADMILKGGTTVQFTPKIVGTNIDNMGSNLSTIRRDRASIAGENDLYYVMDNLSASPTTATVSLHVYSLED